MKTATESQNGRQCGTAPLQATNGASPVSVSVLGRPGAITWVGLDTGKTTGWAWRTPDGRRQCGVWQLAPKGVLDPGLWVATLRAEMTELLEALALVHVGRIAVAYEHPSHHAGTRAGQIFGAWWGTLLLVRQDAGVSLVPANVAQWGAWAGIRGKHKERKAQSPGIARARGWEPCDDNAADAALILEWAAAHAEVTR